MRLVWRTSYTLKHHLLIMDFLIILIMLHAIVNLNILRYAIEQDADNAAHGEHLYPTEPRAKWCEYISILLLGWVIVLLQFLAINKP